jgi:hypothetical protein
MAQSPSQPFQPTPPPSDKFDWIQLTSDEWLKGEFIALYDDDDVRERGGRRVRHGEYGCGVGRHDVYERSHQRHRLHGGLPLSRGQTRGRTLYAPLPHRPVDRFSGAARRRFSFVWDRVQEPRPESSGVVPEKDDYRLIVGVGFDF